MTTWRFVHKLVVLLPPFLLMGCSVGVLPLGLGSGPPKQVITAAEIQDSGATNAWEVLERNGASLQLADERMPERERKRLELTDLPRVVVDGIQMLEVRLLRDIPAHLISRIRILSGFRGDPVYNTGSANDIIVIETRSAPRR